MVLSEVQAEIQKMRDEGLSYGKIGKLYDLNKAVIYRVLNEGYEPKDKSIRRKLGLEKETVNFIKQIRSPDGTFTKK